jgi:C4-dicarboxylate transporter, DctQ subunit
VAQLESPAMVRDRSAARGHGAVRVVEMVIVQSRRITSAAAYVAAFLVVAMALFMSFDVLMRYGFGRATAIADDITAYMLVAITFLGAGSAQLANKHINVETVVGLLAPRHRRMLHLVGMLVVLGYVVFVAWQAFPYVATSRRLLYLSSGLVRFPLWIPQAFIPIGLCVLVLAIVVNVMETAMDVLGRRR